MGEIGSTFSNIDFVIFTVGRLHPQLTTNCSQLEIELTVGSHYRDKGGYQGCRGMLKGTQDETRISLSVRQKHSLPVRDTGGIGDFFGVWLALGIVLECVMRFAFHIRSPISSVPE